MTVAESLLHRHLQTLVADNARGQTLLADDVVWELPFAPALGHPARVVGRAEVEKFAGWFVGAVEGFRFLDARVQACADPQAAVAEVKGEGRIKATGACLPPGVRGVPACLSGEDRVPARVLRSDPGGEGDERAHPRPRLLTCGRRRGRC